MIYGGWMPRGGTFSDVWAAHIGDKATDFMARLAEQAPQDSSEQDFDDDNDQEMETRLRHILGLLQGRGLSGLHVRMQGQEDSDDDDDDATGGAAEEHAEE